MLLSPCSDSEGIDPYSEFCVWTKFIAKLEYEYVTGLTDILFYVEDLGGC